MTVRTEALSAVTSLIKYAPTEQTRTVSKPS